MRRLDLSIIEYNEDKTIFGLCQQSNDRTQAKDIPALSKRYYEAAGKHDGEVIPFFVVSSGYDTGTKDFKLFIGGETESTGLETFMIPKGLYAKVTVRPKMGFMWGMSIGEAKRTFYMEWLPKSEYASSNMEYEFHTEMSRGKKPHIDILFAIQKVFDTRCLTL